MPSRMIKIACHSGAPDVVIYRKIVVVSTNIVLGSIVIFTGREAIRIDYGSGCLSDTVTP